MKYIGKKCVNCNKNRKLKSDKLCNRCHSKQTKCANCNRKKALVYEKKLCDSCYYYSLFYQVNSGNQDIDKLIKATYNNLPQFRLEWIPFNDFIDIKRIGTGGFSEIYAAKWTKGRISDWNE